MRRIERSCRLLLGAAVVVFGSVTDVRGEFLDLYSKDGKLIQAKVDGIEAGKVKLVRKTDGKRFEVPIDKFDAETQKLLTDGLAPEPGSGGSFGPFGNFPPDDGSRSKKLYPRPGDEIVETVAEIRADADKQAAFEEDAREACRILNVYRYFSGLSHDVELDKGYCEQSVVAATGCEKLGSLSHDVNAEAGRCNLTTQTSISESVHGYIDDAGDNNREVRGHRAWCLSRNMGKFGIDNGEAQDYSAMFVFDKSGGSKVREDFYAYPSQGWYPTTYLKANTAWSVYFPGASLPSKDGFDIKVYRIPKPPEKPYRAGDVPEGGEEFPVEYISTAKVVDPCVNFEPNVVPVAGEIYWVSVKARSVKAAYLVEFFDPEG